MGGGPRHRKVTILHLEDAFGYDFPHTPESHEGLRRPSVPSPCVGSRNLRAERGLRGSELTPSIDGVKARTLESTGIRSSVPIAAERILIPWANKPAL
jgi:hypothetical protein